jgi:flagellar biosynthesis protein FliR
MHAATDLLTGHFLTFTLVFARVAALVAIAPVFGPASAPARVRALLALGLALLLAPLELEKPAPAVHSLVDYLVLVGGEALVGMTLGLGILLLFTAMHVAGQIVSQMSGVQLAEVIDPSFDANVPAFSQLFFYVTLAVFVTIGGHRRVMEALLDTFVWLPAGQASVSRSVTEAMTTLLAESFVLGLRAAAPAMVALLLAALVMGLISRTLPQLNVMALGFGLNALVTLAAVSVSLVGAAWVFQDQLEPVLQTVLGALKPGASVSALSPTSER